MKKKTKKKRSKRPQKQPDERLERPEVVLGLCKVKDKYHIRGPLVGKAYCGMDVAPDIVEPVNPRDILLHDVCTECIVGHLTRREERREEACML